MVNMTSFEVIQAQTDSNSSEAHDSAEFSFLPIPSDTIHDNSFNMTNLQSALMSATPDLSVEEVQNRLLELLEENEELKEALKKNNVMMQEQLTTVAAWHEQMVQTKKSQQAKLEEASVKISVLQKENVDLNAKIKDLEQSIEAESKETTCSKCNILEIMSGSLQVENTNLQKDKEELVSELNQQRSFHKQLENNISGISSYLEHLQSNSKLLAEEKRELTAINNGLQVQLSAISISEPLYVSDEESGYAVVSHPHQNDATALKDALLQLHETEENLPKLKKTVKDLNIEIETLKKKCAEQDEKICLYEKERKSQEEAVKTKFEISENKLELASSSAKKYKDMCDNLQQDMDECQAKLEQVITSDSHAIENMKKEIINLQEVLKFEQCRNKDDKNTLQEYQTNMEKLSKDYERVTRLLEIQTKDQKEKDKHLDNMKEYESKMHLEQIDALTAKLVDTEQQLEDQQETVRKLLSELSTVKTDAETIPILKSQVEVYKIDFENERSAKESAHNEVERLTKEIKLLQEKNFAPGLASSLSGSWTSFNPTSRKPRRKRSGPDEAHGVEQNITCPFCSRGFVDLKSAQSHVNACGDINDH